MQEELPVLLASNPLFKLIAYRKVFCQGSISDSIKVLDSCCKPLNRKRKEEGGRFRIDQVLLEAIDYESKNVEMQLDDILEEMVEERDIDVIRLKEDEYLKMPVPGGFDGVED